MNFDHKAISPGSHSRFSQRFHISADSCGMAGICDYRQMTFGPNDRYGADVQGVAGAGLIGAYSALAQNDIGVALRDNIFRCIYCISGR